jgi:carnitine O-acetyltransferase
MSTETLPPKEQEKQNGKATPAEANMDPPTVTSKLNGGDTSSSQGRTFALQHKLPKLPVPPLKDTCERYLRALQGLQVSFGNLLHVQKRLINFPSFPQDEEEHAQTRQIVMEFCKPGGEGEKWQKKLEDYSEGVDSYVEEFWCAYFHPSNAMSS